MWSARRFFQNVRAGNGLKANWKRYIPLSYRLRHARLRAVRPGATAKAVDAAARSFIAEAGFDKYFNHGLGHGIGLQVHEAPDIRSTSSDVLRAGMVFTLEPGIYLPGFGGVRIEDNILVTPDGCEVLSSGVAKEWEESVVGG